MQVSIILLQIISKLFYYGNFTGVSSSIFKKTNVQGIYGTIEINIHCNSSDFYVDDKYIFEIVA